MTPLNEAIVSNNNTNNDGGNPPNNDDTEGAGNAIFPGNFECDFEDDCDWKISCYHCGSAEYCRECAATVHVAGCPNRAKPYAEWLYECNCNVKVCPGCVENYYAVYGRPED